MRISDWSSDVCSSDLPVTKDVLKTPVIIFPPWINRYYILDLNPQKSFIRWAVEQGLTVFVVSWKSADESMKDVSFDDYVIGGQIKAIDVVRELLGVQTVNVIGYLVAGTSPGMSRDHVCDRNSVGGGEVV